MVIEKLKINLKKNQTTNAKT